MSTQPFFFYIDVLGSGACNLRCPTCPVGNWPELREPKGLMEPETLDRILVKARAETEISGVGLFNWTEPLLHPRIGELMRVVSSHGLNCHLSSNLNHDRNLEEAFAARPASFRISMSGFHQQSYGRTHAGGDVETVKRNLVRVAALRDAHGSATDVNILYHRYADNLDDEVELRALAARLGIRFATIWAFMMPIEKVLAYLEEDPDLAPVTAEDLATIGMLGLPLREALGVARDRREMDCRLQSAQMTLDYEGEVQLCCAVFDADRFSIGNFLETPLAELQRRKQVHSMCDRCMKQGGHVYYMIAAPEFASLAEERLDERHREIARRFPAIIAS